MSSSKSVSIESSSEFEEISFNETKDILVMASIKAPLFEKKAEDKRAPIDICCVIDRSGSMGGEKIQLTREALEFVMKNLEPNDNLSIVIYDEQIETLFDFTGMTEENKNKKKSDIEKIKSRGSTDLCGGLLRGLDLALSRKSPNDVCSILLMTDGLANHGISEKSQIEAAMSKKMLSFGNKKPSVFTFGFGKDHNEELLKNLSESGSGMYYYIKTAEEIPISFADCLGGLQSVVAQNISLSLNCVHADSKILKCLNKSILNQTYPTNKLTFALGDLYSEENRDIIFMVQVPSIDQPSDEKMDYFNFELGYFNVIEVNDEKSSSVLQISRPGTLSGKMIPNIALDQQRNRLKTAEAIEKSRDQAEKGNFKGAQSIIQEMQKEIEESPSGKEFFCIKLVEDLSKCLEDVKSDEQYQYHGKKMMMKKAQAHYQQRSTRVDDEEEYGFYETSAKANFKASSKK